MRKIFAVAALIASSPLLAQDSTRTLDQVTVTATKYSVKTTETGKVVTLITRQDIEHAGSRDLAQVITELGGVFINGYTSNAGKEKNIYLRGARVDYTLITIDGVPVYDASGIGSNFDIRNIPVDNVERIEILKGSQSTLYGSDAIAGVINIITRKGTGKPFNFSGAADWGSYNTRRLNAAISGASSRIDYNIGFTHYATDGFSEAQQPYNSTTKFDRDPYRQNSVLANFGIRAAKNVRLLPFFRYTKFKGSLDADAFTDATDYTNTNRNLQAGIRNEISLGSTRLNIQYQFVNTRRDYLDDSTQRGSYYVYNEQAYRANEHFVEAFAVVPFGAFKLTAGADFRTSATGSTATQVNIYSPFVDRPAQSADTVNQQQIGAYAALNYSSGNFSVEGGGRFNHHSEYGSNFAFNFNPSYLVMRQLKVFANVSSGYKTPSLYQLFSAYGNRALQPETSVNFEGGLQFFTKDQLLDLRALYFRRRIEDAIAFFTDPVTFSSHYVNQDKQNDHGFEVEGSARIAGKVQLKLNYGYVTGRITTLQGGKDTTYFNLLRRPKSTLTFSVGTQVTHALYLNLNFNSIGDRSDVYFDPVTFASRPVTLNSYVLVNFYAEYGLAGNRLKFFADLRNVFDEQYSDIYGYNTAGFNAYGGLRFHF